MNEHHPQYQKMDCHSKLRLSLIELNYDPTLVLRTFSFFKRDSDYSPPEQMFD